MKILLLVALTLALALPSLLGDTVVAAGWGSSFCYELWMLVNAGVVIGFYCTTRNIFNVWGAVLLTGIYLTFFGVYTGITPITISLAGVGLGLLAAVFVYALMTAVQVCLLKGGSRESFSVLPALLVAALFPLF